MLPALVQFALLMFGSAFGEPFNSSVSPEAQEASKAALFYVIFFFWVISVRPLDFQSELPQISLNCRKRNKPFIDREDYYLCH